MLCDVTMDANGNGKQDPLCTIRPKYLQQLQRREASNDVSRVITLTIISEIRVTRKCNCGLDLHSFPNLFFDSIHIRHILSLF